jgi:hypothetical protein
VAARAQERRADEKEHPEREAEYKDVAKESGLVRGGKLKPPKTAKYGSGQDDNELEANLELARLRRGPSVILPPHSLSLWRTPTGSTNVSDE